MFARNGHYYEYHYYHFYANVITNFIGAIIRLIFHNDFVSRFNSFLKNIEWSDYFGLYILKA